jgi:hypothetical protein
VKARTQSLKLFSSHFSKIDLFQFENEFVGQPWQGGLCPDPVRGVPLQL